ncbi:amidohydrolase [Kribbella deserti]|uniref:Amidohydrolase n=1 Tax=Kribbella deserti TaxID=1926257 RepID=A0ABV6QH41_9ACTN
MRQLVVRNCAVLVVPEVGECSIEPARDIWIDDGVITAIKPTSPVVAEGIKVVEGCGLLAVPGLTNSHTHSPMVLMRGAAEDLPLDRWFNERIWPMEVNLTPELVRVGARLACAEMLLGGVTTFVDHYFHSDQIAFAAAETGIRADLAPTFFSSNGPDEREAAYDAARGIGELGLDRVTASLGPHAPYTVTGKDLERTAEVARAEGFRIHLHAAETMDQTTSSQARFGVTPVEVLERTGVLDAGSLIAHGCGILPGDLAILERYADRTAVASCPKVYLKMAIGSTTPFRGLREAGIAVGAGTDGAAVHNTLDVWEALRLIGLVEKQNERDATWMTVSDVLRMATRGGAAAAGLGAKAGALEAGRLADIALVDLNQPHVQPVHDPRAALVYSTRASDVVTVIVDGDVVVHERRLIRLDLADIVCQAREVAPRLVDFSQGGSVQTYQP